MVDEAVAVLELNVEVYPGSFNPHDSLGEAYMTAGRTTEAIASYERSLELNPDNANGAAMLARLRGQTPDP
jgi:cytochrome c-type biogenesis protein CcmH/NrfG